MVKRSGSEVVPKGWMRIWVAGGAGETPEKFLVPVGYLNHPLFINLLKAAEEEFGFDHQGAITLPCRLQDFRRLKSLIDRDRSSPPPPANNSHSHYLFDVAACRCFWVSRFIFQHAP